MRGFCVFPCRPRDKVPAVPDRWEQRACADPATVARYWPSARHNVGIACGPSRLVVIDLDTHGALPAEWQLPGITDGRDVLAQLCEWAGQPWPCTYAVATPSGGQHLYYRAPAGADIRNSAGKIGPLVDVRASGGYVIGAGSAADGHSYDVLTEGGPQPLPRWLARLLTTPQKPQYPRNDPVPGPGGARLAGLVRAVESAPDGQLNDTLHWAACRAAEMREEGGCGEAEAAAALLTAAVRAGHPERSAARTIASGLRGGVR